MFCSATIRVVPMSRRRWISSPIFSTMIGRQAFARLVQQHDVWISR